MPKEQTVPYASKPVLIPAAEWFGGGTASPMTPTATASSLRMMP